MRYDAAFIFALSVAGCKNSEPENVTKIETKKDTAADRNDTDSKKLAEVYRQELLEIQKSFIGNYTVTYFDGSSKNISIDSSGKIKDSKNYKFLRVIDTKHIYLVKGNEETKGEKDTFSFEQENNHKLKLYLNSKNKKEYKFTLIKK